jgi:hypothetical protein
MYFQKQPSTHKKFVSTNVIPILNRAWPTSLGNKEFAKKLFWRGVGQC